MSVLRYEKSDGIATMTFEWPVSNAGLAPDGERELAEAVSDFSRDPSVSVGVLTGTGDMFCGEWTEPDLHVADARQGFNRFSTIYPFSGSTDKPVIAAVNGAATGRGFELALDCDVRIAVAGATLALGTAAGDRRLIYAAQVLPRLVPFGEAMLLLLSEGEIEAAEAKRIGLVQDVVSPEALMPAAANLARAMVKNGLPGLTATKRIGLLWRNMMLNQSYELARSLMKP